ncbi:hypothetical protein ASPZODRAFT_153404 [Penicilliopsis zonata CBS 506.65]|uniref:Uncharacterized protein n=1 Tax=Penicilliopsis zonata CBS 506.65 TaxID=1073090 RepID=A0A1L9SD39_9EURO|nr:hypothetical protein ASPZODRAFT_153404 [Penicilliopsis zonata CBS 506.65]OJJ45116.1 hypothetical protein ASPZODRAFT_153404 [Penicilliopsis zonata CBS 506.65]
MEEKSIDSSIWRRLRRGRKPPIPETRQPNPEHGAGFFSLLTFSWMSPIIATGYRRSLEVNDIWLVHPDRRAQEMAARLQASFHAYHGKGASRPLARAIFQTFKKDIIVGALASFVSSMLQVLIPFVVRFVVAYAVEVYDARLSDTDTPRPAIGRGIGLVVGIAIMQVFASMGYNHFFYRGMLVGGQIRASLIAMIFNKAMTISGRARAGETTEETKDTDKGTTTAWGNGRIINLMSVDTSRIDTAAGWFHMIWSAPLGLIVTIILLLINLSYPALVGLALFFSAVPVMVFIVRNILRRRAKINAQTDERTTLTQEVLQAIRFLKYYAWEGDFLARLAAVRRKEVRGIRFLLGHRNIAIAMGSAVPVFASMLTFITSTLTNHALAPATTFSSLALFNQLRIPLIMFPMVIGLVADATKSLKRLEEFFMAEDAMDVADECKDGLVINLQDASFTWERAASSEERKQDQQPFTLDNITLQLSPSELIAVVGSVGSGKSSLLSAMSGEMRRTSGQLQTRGRRAMSAQVAWIQNATVRDNITFGREFVQEEYDRVVDACALSHDLQILTHGSDTEIGERGINLSGGQKQRVSLARAVYSDADIVLLDDPLGAVDPHVGAHIMDHAICGLMKDKCRILVTHQLHVLPRCDRIVVMDRGRIVACDTFENLMASNKIMQTFVTEQAQELNSEALTHPQAKGKEQEVVKDKQQQMQQEGQERKGISSAVYIDYFKSTGSLLLPPLVLLVLCTAQACNIMTNLWLAWWSENHYGFPLGVNIGVYAVLGISQGILLLLAGLGFTIFGTEASKRMMHRAMQSILCAPMSFFDTTPLGRIMNRLSKDIDVMDNNLTESLRAACTTVSMLISIIILTIAYYYYFAVALVPLCVFYLVCAAYYRSSALAIKRHEAVFRSNVFAKFNEAVLGTTTIRAYGMQARFSGTLTDAIDTMDSAYYLTFGNQRWLGVRIDGIGVVFLIVTGMLVVTDRFTVSPSISGLVLSYLVSVTQALLLAVRQVADAQNNMNAVERVHEYTGLTGEGSDKGKGGNLPGSWPVQGQISFNNVQMRYRDGLPLVLDGLDLQIHAGERLGIVGRTGAGKSSIMVALFRLVELAGGSVCIDDVDISTISLKDLRSRLAIIPQDPTLFRGTVRSNLDPFGQHSDGDLWYALRQANLVDEDEHKDGRVTLDTVVESEGTNFSLGQRQLMGLARALVRDSRIIVCDEATSSIDLESDSKVQQTMADAFRDRTVLVIAHRLRTIINYDRVVVIEDGGVLEIGKPLELYDRGGKFRAMCDRSAITREDFETIGPSGRDRSSG